MPWSIPDKGEAQNDNQSILFQVYLDAIIDAMQRTEAVTSGCAVTAQGSPNMTVAVAAGAVMSGGGYLTTAGGTGTVTTADGTNPRIDLVVINSAGAVAVRAGTPAAAPKPPNKTAGDVLLAAVYVPASDTTISSDQIVDLRVDIPDALSLVATISPAQITATQNDYNPTGLSTAKTLIVTVDQARSINGIAGGFEGRNLLLINGSTNADGDLILRAENTGSTASNRFAGDSDIVIEPQETALIQYDGTLARWRIVGGRRKYTGSTFRLTPYIFTDFWGAATADTGEASYAPWDVALISTGTQSKTAGEPNHPGILRFTSSTTANSGGYCRTDITTFRLGGGEVTEFVFRVIDLTTLTARFGFIDTGTSADCVDGAYLELLSTGALTGKTSNNSTRTTSASLGTLSINTWYRVRIVVNKAATAVDFYLFDDAGNQLGTAQITTNIPTAAGRETGHGYIATKSGTVAQACIEVDFMSIEFTRALI